MPTDDILQRVRRTLPNTGTAAAPGQYRVDWGRIADTHIEPEPPLTIEEWGEEEPVFVEDRYPSPQVKKIKRLDLRTAIELFLEQWSWLAETGKRHEDDWPRWVSLGISYLNTLCEYSSKRKRKLPLVESMGYSHCNVCPYVKQFGHKCDNNREPFYHWLRSNDKDRKFHASQFIKKILMLRKEAILNPSKFK